MISPQQSKGARAMLDMSRSDLASAAGIAERTLVDFERGARTPHANNLAAIQRALEDAGVRFTDHGVELPPKDAAQKTADNIRKIIGPIVTE